MRIPTTPSPHAPVVKPGPEPLWTKAELVAEDDGRMRVDFAHLTLGWLEPTGDAEFRATPGGAVEKRFYRVIYPDGSHAMGVVDEDQGKNLLWLRHNRPRIRT